jgi:hypothetical protein
MEETRELTKRAKYPAQTVILTTEAVKEEVKAWAREDEESASEIFRQIMAVGLPIYRKMRAEARAAHGDTDPAGDLFSG